jgi:hypothetical protein
MIAWNPGYSGNERQCKYMQYWLMSSAIKRIVCNTELVQPHGR